MAWLEEHKATPGVAMPALQKAQEIYGYLPIEVQRIVANTLGKPLAEIYGISTFYSQFSLCPKGEYKISVCLGTACYVKGSRQDLREAAGKAGYHGRRMHGRRQVQPGCMPLHRRVRPGPCHDDQRRCIRPPDGRRTGRHSGKVLSDAGIVDERAGRGGKFRRSRALRWSHITLAADDGAAERMTADHRRTTASGMTPRDGGTV